MNHELKVFLTTIVIMFSVLGVLAYYAVEEDNERKTVCEEKGGDYVQLHRAAICVPKGTVIDMSETNYED